jgi:hypothetical protein
MVDHIYQDIAGDGLRTKLRLLKSCDALGGFADQDAVGRRSGAGADAEQGIEGGMPYPAPIEAEHELVEVVLQVGFAQSVVDAQAPTLFRYEMHTLPSEISDAIGTSTLWAAWNAAVYVAQIDDGRLSAALADRAYLDATQAVLREHGGLWFWDEAFVISRKRRLG